MPTQWIMPKFDQATTKKRYLLIPRTLVFLRREESYLLIRGSATKRIWAGKYNGPGGHVERGEDILSSARRELIEETGLDANLWLSGMVTVDVGKTGICLYVFSGDNYRGDLKSSDEGIPEWILYKDLDKLPVVEDLPILLERIHQLRPGDRPFSARSFYDPDQRLVVSFAE